MTQLGCKVCSAEPTKLDRFYKQNLCSSHWEQRKQDAIAQRHVEWLDANQCEAEVKALEEGNFDASGIDVESTRDSGIPGRD